MQRWCTGSSGREVQEIPTVLRVGPYRFYFFSNEQTAKGRTEPPHVHVKAGSKQGKIWLTPVRVARQGQFSDKEMNDIVNIVKANHTQIVEGWHDYFG